MKRLWQISVIVLLLGVIGVGLAINQTLVKQASGKREMDHIKAMHEINKPQWYIVQNQHWFVNGHDGNMYPDDRYDWVMFFDGAPDSFTVHRGTVLKLGPQLNNRQIYELAVSGTTSVSTR